MMGISDLYFYGVHVHINIGSKLVPGIPNEPQILNKIQYMYILLLHVSIFKYMADTREVQIKTALSKLYKLSH